MTEALLNKPYWVVDILPEQVPADSAGRYFAVERYYLRQPGITDIHYRFTDILLKLNCYSDFLVCLPDREQQIRNPEPEVLASWINAEQKDLCIVLEGEDALVTLNHDDTCMTVYSVDKPDPEPGGGTRPVFLAAGRKGSAAGKEKAHGSTGSHHDPEKHPELQTGSG